MCRKIFHFFRFNYAEMRRKLWPKASAKEDALGQMSKNFQVYFIHIHFFKKLNKKIYNRAKELYCDATIFVFWFFIVYLPKKNGNWQMAQGCQLSPTHCQPASTAGSVTVYWRFWVFMGFWVSMGVYGCLWESWVFISFYGCHGCLCVFMDFWVSVSFYGCLWVSECLWVSMGVYGLFIRRNPLLNDV